MTRPGRTLPGSTRDAVEAVWRIESARIVSTLARYTGDFALAEDLAQEALAAALVSWPRDGVPSSPAAWLLTVGRRRAVDAYRRRAALDDRYAVLARDLDEGTGDDVLWDPDRLDDDVLALMFVACHPVLSREAQLCLTLRVVGGLTSDEIARALLVPTATVQARITRAKKTLAAAQVPFEVPPPEERRQRLGAVLNVLYLVFTEGSSASSGADWIRTDLAHEAVRQVRVLAQLVPDEAEVHGLLALLELTAARFPARVRDDGEPVLLEAQDRRRWDRAAIRRGRAALATAGRVGRGLGAYGVQAAIAECHAVAPSVEETDWDRIVLLYEALGRLAPSPVVELNRAVAVSMAQGPAAALRIVDGLVAAGSLAGSHLLPAVRGELLTRLGRPDDARKELEEAARRCGNDRERELLERKVAALE
ncbi:sigma-70 family RNA polymerase sigma factor [uncultured Cellulomonas sp.]|uniref:RNA polymerase sigma factor n=1 Tax=uncultured Cellulomonas sp. TaxID=189682 RepID=UPI0028F04941|nr:sigma-70 family RNA polymerase sigma factor [uncultured Cellulomonas sp.]